MNTQFDWSLVPLLPGALDHGSLLGAARALGASQPTLGRHIAELEVAAGRGAVRAHRPRPAADRRWRSAWPRRRAPWKAAPTSWCAASPGAGGRWPAPCASSASQPVACFLMPPRAGADARWRCPQVQVELVASNEVSNLLRREADIALRMVQPDQASLVARRIAQGHAGHLRAPRLPARAAARRASRPTCWPHDLIGDDRDGSIAARPSRRSGYAGRARGLRLAHRRPGGATGRRCAPGWASASSPTTWRATDPQVVPVLPMLKIPAAARSG